VPITLNNEVVAGQDSLYASACIDTLSRELIIKIVNASNKEQVNMVALEGLKKKATEGEMVVLKANLTDANSFADPVHVAPVTAAIPVSGNKVRLVAAPYSVDVIRIKMQ
jgi:alpha-L-arabinofuranosidase